MMLLYSVYSARLRVMLTLRDTVQFSLVLVVEEINANLSKIFSYRKMLSVVPIICLLIVFASGKHVINRMEELYRWKQLGYDQLSIGNYQNLTFFEDEVVICWLDHILYEIF